MIIDRNSPIPQYFQLQTWLIEQIEQGVFKPNDKIPTEEELSGTTGLARATIRQAIQNLANLGYLERKRRLGTFVLNRKNQTDQKTIIGLLVPDIRSGYAPELARGAEDEASKNKHSLILCNTDELFVKANYHADRLLEHAISGVIFMPTAATNEQNRLIIEKFKKNNTPVVLADRNIPYAEVDYVTTDNFQGGYFLTKYLLNCGHQKVAVLLSTLFSTEQERLAGYYKAFEEAGLLVDDSIIFAEESPFVQNHYIEYIRKILSNHEVTAIFTGHDRVAYLVYSIAQEMNLNIPEDISVVGYDDLLTSETHPMNLTTMHQPTYEIGKESMRLVMSRIQGNEQPPQHIVLKSRFVERSSVAAIAS